MRRLLLLSVFLITTALGQDVPEAWPHPSELTPEPIEFTAPEPRRETLSNGIEVFLMEDRTLPLIRGVAYVDAPTLFDPDGMAGTAAMTAALLREGGAGDLTPDELDATLERLAASVEASASAALASVGFDTLSDTADEVLPIWRDVLLRPRFDERRLEVLRQRQVEAIRRVVDDPVDLAFREFLSLVVGDHPSGDYPTEASVSAVERSDVVAFYERHYGPEVTVVAVTGDFETEAMLATLEELLGGWRHEVAPPPEIPPLPEVEPQVFLLPREIAQSIVVVGHPSVRAYTPAYHDLDVVNHILGAGGFTSRLFSEIRTRRGLAYATGSVLTQGFRLPGTFVAYSISPSTAAPEVLGLLLDEIERLRQEGVTELELEHARQSIVNASLFRFVTAAAITERTARVWLLGLEPGYFDDYLANVRDISPADVQGAARAELHPERAVVLVVGDPAQFAGSLEAFGEVTTIEVE
jgi:zinc protease